MSPGSMTYSETERETDLAQKSSCSASAQAHYYLAWEKPVVQKRHLTLTLELAIVFGTVL